MDLGVVPVAQPADPAVAKAAFQIDLQAQRRRPVRRATPLQGSRARMRKDEPILSFTFAQSTCATCPLFARCVRSKTLGCTVRTNAHEELLQAARLRQQTAEFKALYPLRSAIERKGAELVAPRLAPHPLPGPAQAAVPAALARCGGQPANGSSSWLNSAQWISARC